MNSALNNRLVLVLACFLFISSVGFGQTQKTNGAILFSEKPTIVSAKREIIKLLLADIFRGDIDETLMLSTKNIPNEIRADFPTFSNLTATFTDSEQNCPFEFQSFIINGKKASVSFGNCQNGLGYTFKKVKGTWRFATSINR